MDCSKVNIAELREVINQVFDFIQKDLNLEEVVLKENYYWSINGEILCSAEKDASEVELSVGSLYDDNFFMKKAKEDTLQAIPVTFIHIAPLLRALASMVPSYVVLDKKDI